MRAENTKKTSKIVLFGNPNSGKSSLFNALTGLKQRVGNYSGVTVESKKGVIKNTHIEVIDFPGCYSLKPRSKDEEHALQNLIELIQNEEVTTIICVVDAANIKRSLFLYSQLKDIFSSVIVCLNMNDIAQKKGIKFDIPALEKKLGSPIVQIHARSRKGIDQLIKTLKNTSAGTGLGSILEGKLNGVASGILKRYDTVNHWLDDTTFKKGEKFALGRFDNILLHPIYGLIIFGLVLFVMFQSIFWLASFPMDGIEWLFETLQSGLAKLLPNFLITRFLLDGLLPALAGIMVFIPQIFLLFLFIEFMENTGYLTRVSFLLDSVLQKMGMNGKSIIPLMGGFACAVPAIMATRTIKNKRERLITLLIIPFLTCSARLPIYVLITALVIPDTTAFGIFHYQGLVMFGLYIAGTLMALASAFTLNKILKREKEPSSIYEVPEFKGPDFKTIFIQLYLKIKTFIWDVGKVILVVSLIIYFLSSFTYSVEHGVFSEPKTVENSYLGKLGKSVEPIFKPLGYSWQIDVAILSSFAAREVFCSTLYTIYKLEDRPSFYVIEIPDEFADKPAVLEYRIEDSIVKNWSPRNTNKLDTLAFELGQPISIELTSNDNFQFLVRDEYNEVVFEGSYLNTQFESAEAGIVESLGREKKADGSRYFTLGVGMSILAFYLFALQCMSTLAITYRETKKWTVPTFQFILMFILAYISAFVMYQIF